MEPVGEKNHFCTKLPISDGLLRRIKESFAVRGEVRNISWAPGYAISSCGRVFSCFLLPRGSIRLKERKTVLHQGYPAVVLQVEGKAVGDAVHRLIADHFLAPKPSPEHQVRHKDGIRTHSFLENLEWGTRADNMQDMIDHGRSRNGYESYMAKNRHLHWGENHGHAKMTEEKVRLARKMSADGMDPKEIGAILGVSRRTIKDILWGVTWKHVV